MDRPEMEVKPAMISAPPIVASLGLVNHNHRFPFFRVPVLSRKLSRLRQRVRNTLHIMPSGRIFTSATQPSCRLFERSGGSREHQSGCRINTRAIANELILHWTRKFEAVSFENFKLFAARMCMPLAGNQSASR